jgi:urease accessory protein
MSAATSRCESARHQRASGALHVALRRRGTATVLAGLRQSGCLKARFPRSDPGAWLECVTLNLSGGVAGGDCMDSAFAIGEGARATIAGQAAERFYRALPDTAPARLRTTITVAPGGAAEWLPQLSILFDGCALDRALSVELTADAWFLGVEGLVFGRAAMGEAVATGRLRDLIRLRRDGRLLLHDAAQLHGPIAAHLARPGVARGARAVATVFHVATDAEAALERVRAALEPAEAGVSAWNGLLLARILAPDGAALRTAIVAAMQAIRGARPLPRVWLC